MSIPSRRAFLGTLTNLLGSIPILGHWLPFEWYVEDDEPDEFNFVEINPAQIKIGGIDSPSTLSVADDLEMSFDGINWSNSLDVRCGNKPLLIRFNSTAPGEP